MKRIDFYYFLTLTLIVGSIMYTLKPESHHMRPAHASVYTSQQLASHFLDLKDEDGKGLGVCTGTAIGPHAILTAAHCDEREEVKQVSFDLATETHKVLSVSGDGRDHIIMLVDGTAFKNTETVVQADAPMLGATVTLYGVGGAEYPPTPKYGRATDCQDPSDVDAASGIWCSSTHVIPGDSGSAVYNSAGEIVGITTYRDDSVKPSGLIGFTLNFTPKELSEAATFDGLSEDLPGYHHTYIKKRKQVDPFFRLFGSN